MKFNNNVCSVIALTFFLTGMTGVVMAIYALASENIEIHVDHTTAVGFYHNYKW